MGQAYHYLSTAFSRSPAFCRRTSFATFKCQHGVLTVRPVGPSLSEREATILSGELQRYFKEVGDTIRTFVLDMSDIEMMSSFGLGMCIDAARKSQDVNATCYTCGMSSALIDLFRLMKVDRLYRIMYCREQLEQELSAC